MRTFLHRLVVTGLAALALAPAIARAQGDSAFFRNVLAMGREYVNDHTLVESGGVWHLFYTRGDMSIRPWMSPGNEISIGHATSRDLLQWERLEPVLTIGASGSLDAAHVYAPAVIRDGDGWLMLYTGNERGFFSGEHILAASSRDLMTWTKLDRPPAPMPGASWAEYYPPGYDSGSGGPVSCRDPFLLRLSDGSYICYYVTRLIVSDGSRPRACVAAATSPDLITWTERGAVLTRLVTGNDVNPYTHPESPCVVERNGHYYLFWKGGSGTRCVMSDDPLDFQEGEEQLVATSHASKVVEWRGQWLITSCSRDINDVMHTFSDRTRGLYLAGLVWDGDRPRVTALPAAMSVDDTDRDDGRPGDGTGGDGIDGDGDDGDAGARGAGDRARGDRSVGDRDGGRHSLRPNPAHAGQSVRVTMPTDGRAPEVLDVLGRRQPVRIARVGTEWLVDTGELLPGSYMVCAAAHAERFVVTP